MMKGPVLHVDLWYRPGCGRPLIWMPTPRRLRKTWSSTTVSGVQGTLSGFGDFKVNLEQMHFMEVPILTTSIGHQRHGRKLFGLRHGGLRESSS